MVDAGPITFARYAYPPNRLGLCGPHDAPALQQAALEGADREIRGLARGFEGAYPYLHLIADANGIADPLDRRVVDAYWLGSEPAARVGRRGLHRDLRDRFRARMSIAEWGWLEVAIAGGSQPSHAFHVLEVFPRTGLLRGDAAPILETIDACRIRWGTVLAVDGEQLTVSAPRLELIEGALRIGTARPELISAWRDGAGLLGGVRPGHQVSLHWGWACDRLSPTQLARLIRSTNLAVATANQTI